jgi:hypothetical protein
MKLTADQIEFQDLIRRFLADKLPSDYLRRRIDSGVRCDPTLIQALEELGIFDSFAGSSPAYGVVELALLAEECGRSLMPEPLVERIICEHILERVLVKSDRDVFNRHLTGKTSAALAFNECCSLRVDANGTAVSGLVNWSVGHDKADVLVAFADTDTGIRAFIAPLNDQSCFIRNQVPSLDLTASLNSIELKSAPAEILTETGTRDLELLISVIKASEVSGICQRVIEMTVDYVKTRNQFGAPIGSFQAIQQKLAQIYAESEALNSLSRFAAWSFFNSEEQRELTARAAIFKASEIGVSVCEVALQCHGGIGFTWEYDLHLFLRRAKAIQAAFGTGEKAAAQLIGAAG